jgi:hypothetical protein
VRTSSTKNQELPHIASDAPLICRTATSCPITLTGHSRGLLVVHLDDADRRGVVDEPAVISRFSMSVRVIRSLLLARDIACPFRQHMWACG